MSTLADRRSRVARVRRVQHLQAAGAAALAEGRLDQLQASAARIATLRAGLQPDTGASHGAALGHAAELAARLDEARRQLAPQIDPARAALALRTTERLGAHVARESAERLQTRAVAEMQRSIETRLSAAFRPRAPKARHDD